MTKEELLKKINVDLFSASDEIKAGLIPFDLVTEVIRENHHFPNFIKTAHFIHPDCTVEVFKEFYSPLFSGPTGLLRKDILEKSPVFKHLEAVATAFECKDASYETIKNTYPVWKSTFDALIKNPHISDEFKVIYFDITEDVSVLPEYLRKIFVFWKIVK